MSTIYDLDTDQQVTELLPPDKRFKTTVAWLQAALRSTVQFLFNSFTAYKNGSTGTPYVTGTYSRGARVIYNKAEYISLKTNNTDVPTVTTSWYKTNGNFIGAVERQLYNGQKVTLEYALNRWFGTTFRQPGGSHSDIYLTNNTKGLPVFIVGGVGNSSAAYGDHSTEFVIDAYVFAGFINLNINVPVAVYNALDSNPANRDNIIRAFADKYVAAGILYTIVTY